MREREIERGEKERERERKRDRTHRDRTHLKLQRERSQKSGFSCPQIIHNQKQYLWLLNYKTAFYIIKIAPSQLMFYPS
jgi:hypothetical protein